MNNAIYNRINDLVDMKMEKNLMDAFAELFDDLTADEPFENRDVVDYITIKLRETAKNINPAG